MLAVAIGYLASVLLAISLLVTNDLKFRWFNLFGCLAFIAYGLMIGAFPVLLTNALLFAINLYYLVKIYRAREHFELVEIRPGDEIIARFLKFYEKDIAAYFPHFNPQDAGKPLSFVVLRDMTIANLFVAEVGPGGTGSVLINYTVPKYRDYKVGHFIFEKEKSYLLSRGIRQLIYRQPVYKTHVDFLERMGFQKGPAGSGIIYSKQLD